MYLIFWWQIAHPESVIIDPELLSDDPLSYTLRQKTIVLDTADVTEDDVTEDVKTTGTNVGQTDRDVTPAKDTKKNGQREYE